MSDYKKNYPDSFLVRRGSIYAWNKYIEDYKKETKKDKWIVPGGQLIAIKSTKEDKNYRLKLGNGIDDFYELPYLNEIASDSYTKVKQDVITTIESEEYHQRDTYETKYIEVTNPVNISRIILSTDEMYEEIFEDMRIPIDTHTEWKIELVPEDDSQPFSVDYFEYYLVSDYIQYLDTKLVNEILDREQGDENTLRDSKEYTDTKDSATREYIDTLIVDYANNLGVNIDSQTYEMTISILNDDKVLVSRTVDLPLEEMIVNVEYDSATKEIIITLKSGQVTRIPIGDIVDGLTHIELVEELPTSNIDDNAIYVLKSGVSYDWVDIANGVPEDENGNNLKYDDNLPDGVSVINVQKNSSGTAGVYITFPAGITSATINGNNVESEAIQGAGLYVFLWNLTQDINEVVVNYAPSNSATIIIQNNNEEYVEEYTEKLNVSKNFNYPNSNYQWDILHPVDADVPDNYKTGIRFRTYTRSGTVEYNLYDSTDYHSIDVTLSTIGSAVLSTAEIVQLAPMTTTLTYQLIRDIEQTTPQESTYHTYIHQDNKWLCLDEEVDLSQYVKQNDRPTFNGLYVVEEPLEVTGGMNIGGSTSTTIAGGNLNVVGDGQFEITKKTIFGGNKPLVIGNTSDVTFGGIGDITFAKGSTMNFTVNMPATFNQPATFNSNATFVKAVSITNELAVQDIRLNGGTRNIRTSNIGPVADTTDTIILGTNGSYKSLGNAVLVGPDNKISDVYNGIVVGGNNNISGIGDKAFGDANAVKGIHNTVIGNNNNLAKAYSTSFVVNEQNKVIGNDNQIGYLSYRVTNTFTIGNSNNIEGDYIWTFGRSNIVSHTQSMGTSLYRDYYVLGHDNNLSSAWSNIFTFGYNNTFTASARDTFVIGNGINANGYSYNYAFGSSITFNGDSTIAVGSYITTQSYGVLFGKNIWNSGPAGYNYYNVAFGSTAAFGQSASYNTTFGQSIYVYSPSNVVFGSSISITHSSASYNTFFGRSINAEGQSASYNVGIGSNITFKNSGNVAIGKQIVEQNGYNTTYGNLFIGSYIFTSATYQMYNMAIGNYVYFYGQSASNNTILGSNITLSSYASNNVAIGKTLNFRSYASDNMLVGASNNAFSNAAHNMIIGSTISASGVQYNIMYGRSMYASNGASYNLMFGSNIKFSQGVNYVIALGDNVYLSNYEQGHIIFGKEISQTGQNKNANVFGRSLYFSSNQTVIGAYNSASSQYSFIIGGGTSNTARKNLLAINSSGYVVASRFSASGFTLNGTNITSWGGVTPYIDAAQVVYNVSAPGWNSVASSIYSAISSYISIPEVKGEDNNIIPLIDFDEVEKRDGAYYLLKNQTSDYLGEFNNMSDYVETDVVYTEDNGVTTYWKFNQKYYGEGIDTTPADYADVFTPPADYDYTIATITYKIVDRHKKVLMIGYDENSQGSSSGTLPSSTVGDAGKILMVNEYGNPEWVSLSQYIQMNSAENISV